MRSWMVLTGRFALWLGTVGWCVDAFAEGGVALLGPPPAPLDPASRATTVVALLLLVWISTIIVLSTRQPPDRGSAE